MALLTTFNEILREMDVDNYLQGDEVDVLVCEESTDVRGKADRQTDRRSAIEGLGQEVPSINTSKCSSK